MATIPLNSAPLNRGSPAIEFGPQTGDDQPVYDRRWSPAVLTQIYRKERSAVLIAGDSIPTVCPTGSPTQGWSLWRLGGKFERSRSPTSSIFLRESAVCLLRRNPTTSGPSSGANGRNGTQQNDQKRSEEPPLQHEASANVSTDTRLYRPTHSMSQQLRPSHTSQRKRWIASGHCRRNKVTKPRDSEKELDERDQLLEIFTWLIPEKLLQLGLDRGFCS